MRLLAKIKIEKIDGKAMDDTDTVGPVNLTLQSIWSQVDVSINHTPVTKLGGTNYPYKSYLDLITKKIVQRQSKDIRIIF
jgi:hypothetical protein